MRSRWKSSQGGKNYSGNWGEGFLHASSLLWANGFGLITIFLLEFVSNCGKEQSKWDIVSSALFSLLSNLFEIGLSFCSPLCFLVLSISPNSSFSVLSSSLLALLLPHFSLSLCTPKSSLTPPHVTDPPSPLLLLTKAPVRLLRVWCSQVVI